MIFMTKRNRSDAPGKQGAPGIARTGLFTVPHWQK